MDYGEILSSGKKIKRNTFTIFFKCAIISMKIFYGKERYYD